MNFDEVNDRRNTGSIKWSRFPEDVLPMWVADMDFQSPECIHTALSQMTEHNIYGYNKPSRGLINSILTMLKENFDWDVKASSLVWIPGIVSALNISCRAYCSTEEKVLMSTPVYPPFIEAPQNSDRKMSTIGLICRENRYEMNFPEIEKKTAEAGLYLLCNPHNPAGRVFSQEELLRLADICLENNIVICSDEIHCDLVLDDNVKHIPIASLSKEIEKNSVTLMSPSKTYNIPGLAFAFAIIPNYKLRKKFLRVMQGIVPYPGTPGRIAAEAAYKHGAEWKEKLLLYLRKNRDFVEEFINRELPEVKYIPGEATYLAWLDVRALKLSKPAVTWFADFGLGISDGNDFGDEGFIRLNFGCPLSVLAEGLERLKNAVVTARQT